MRKNWYWTIGCMVMVWAAGYAQTTVLQGTVRDADTQEPLFAATVTVGIKGTTTDPTGNFALTLPNGNYELRVSYVGYDEYALPIVLTGEPLTLTVTLGGVKALQEVTVTADIAIARKTPVAFSNISTAKLMEELASQDIPMVLNRTPGAYATQTGGGDGDARVSIRGFNQRNIAVMLDGIPVNDMENGWVYWSNWFGLDVVTQTMQVQRGLGASKLAIPSVGGTINILTKGIEAKKSVRLKQEIANNAFIRSTLGITTGRLDKGWGISAALSYKQGNGWVDATFTKGFFYYLRVDKAIGKHLVSFSGFGAPQQHGQRPFADAIAVYDSAYAVSLGVPTDVVEKLPFRNQGLRYNEHWGMLNGKALNTRQNYYHKPQLSLRHAWTATPKWYWSNVAYLSIGTGGGVAPYDSPDLAADGQLHLQGVYDLNQATSIFKPDRRAENVLRTSANNHFWYGLLSTFKYDHNNFWNFSGGLDVRNYRGDHYRAVYDLLGGDYFRGRNNARIDQLNTPLLVGDKFDYDNTGYVRWGGLFGLAEYTKDRWSAFVNLSTAQTGYALEDFMKPMVVKLADTSFYVSYTQPVTLGDVTYTVASQEADNQRINWIWQPSFTVKSGASWRIDTRQSVFINLGYLSRAPRFTNVIVDNRTNANPIQPFDNLVNEKVKAAEIGYHYQSPTFTAHANAYYTIWANKPLDNPPTVLEDPSDPDSDRIPVNISGIAARHAGVEVDFIYKISDQLSVEGLASVGDWRWTSSASATLPDGSVYTFDATGVPVGDAAQIQYGGMVRYEPVKRGYAKLNVTYFAKNFANFNPEDLRNTTARLTPWQMPNYALADLHAGYAFRFADYQLHLRTSVLNLFNARYITDATNNDRFIQSFNDFDAKSASVFMGLGRRWNITLELVL